MNTDLQKTILKRIEDHEERIRALEVDTQPASVQTGAANLRDLILSIVNKIGDCDESEEIQRKVFEQKSMEGKILLCFYISHKYFDNAWLTSGDIEKITSDLGIKIDKRNVTNKIKELKQYLESGAVRRKGQPTPYRLNRKGFKRFEEILKNK